MKLSVIVASTGRPSLPKTLNSITDQMEPGDQLLVDLNDDAPWGHEARNRTMKIATGDALMFIDDDDIYLPGALKAVRCGLAQRLERVHIFRMAYTNSQILWVDKQVRVGNVSTQMVVVRWPALGRWGNRYEGDYDFVQSSCDLAGPPAWHTDVIALIDGAL